MSDYSSVLGLDFAETEDPDFIWFRDQMPEGYWAKYDLSAVRLGWEAHKASTEKELKRLREYERVYKDLCK